RRRPPRSPLFPYTTLFRSAPEALRSRIERVAERVDPAAPLDRAAQGHHRHLRVAHPGIMTRLFQPAPFPLFPGRVTLQAQRKGGDRKSTRLNSSHVAISYA